MGISIRGSLSEAASLAHYRTHKAFLLCNYVLLGAASSCIFLTISLRLVPSLSGFFLILLHVLTIAAAIYACAASSSSSSDNKWYGAHMVSTVLAAILQGSVAVLAFTRTSEFLTGALKSYVREEDGAVILRMIGGLGVLIFCVEWMAMAVAFVLRYYAYVEGDCAKPSTSKVRHVYEGEVAGNSPYPFQV